MRPKTPKKWKKGDAITAARLNEMLDLIMRLDITVPQGSPLQRQQSATGTTLSLDLTGYGFLAVSNGTVGVASGMSGGSPGATGTGTVGTFYPIQVTPVWSGNSLNSVSFVALSTPIIAYNASKTAQTSGSISSGQLCWLQMDNTGLYMATPLECA